MQDRGFLLGTGAHCERNPTIPAKGSTKPRKPPLFIEETSPGLLRTSPRHTSGTPIFRHASKKLSTFFRDLRVLSFGWGVCKKGKREESKGGGKGVPCPIPYFPSGAPTNHSR